jgi:hypothetical protein
VVAIVAAIVVTGLGGLIWLTAQRVASAPRPPAFEQTGR